MYERYPCVDCGHDAAWWHDNDAQKHKCNYRDCHCRLNAYESMKKLGYVWVPRKIHGRLDGYWMKQEIKETSPMNISKHDIAKKKVLKVIKDVQRPVSEIVPLQSAFDLFIAQQRFNGTPQDTIGLLEDAFYFGVKIGRLRVRTKTTKRRKVEQQKVTT